MAKLHQGILGGFSGTVGTIIGYRRNNQWFMRAKPRSVANPRTEAQQAHRRQFGDMVSLASKLLPALKVGMRHYAPQHAMTAGNAFVHLNWVKDGAISLKDMKLSVGPVPMVTFTEITVEDGVLTLRWDKNLHHHGAKNEDTIKIYAYSEEMGLTQCVATAERRSRRLSTLLPDAFRDAHLWALIEDPMGRLSESTYLDSDTINPDPTRYPDDYEHHPLPETRRQGGTGSDSTQSVARRDGPGHRGAPILGT